MICLFFILLSGTPKLYVTVELSQNIENTQNAKRIVSFIGTYLTFMQKKYLMELKPDLMSRKICLK